MTDKRSLIRDEENFEEVLEHLIEVGQQKGSITIEDVLKVVPGLDDDPGELDGIVHAIEAAGITFESQSNQVEDGASEEVEQEAEETPVDQILNASRKTAASSIEELETGDMIGMYLREASRVPLLSADQEIELASSVEIGRAAQQELAQGNATASRMEDLQRMIEQGWSARDHLVRANARLVISVAKKYMNRGLPFLDLIQEGNIGLMRSIKKYDYHRGYKFSTYATWWIRQAITRAISDHSRTIRLPAYIGDQANKMLREQHRLQQKLGRYPTTEELAEALSVSKAKIEQMMKVVRPPISLQEPIGDNEDDDRLDDFIEDQDAVDPEDEAIQSIFNGELRQALEALPPRELRVLQLRFGLNTGQSMTLKEVGDRMGITRERARQLEAQALSHLRRSDGGEKLRVYAE
ncbi:MAG: sigma-70 family RNA polymerase sigma factor [Anaerolineales bacterium]|jgi:RNA polymerase primary sigma factor